MQKSPAVLFYTGNFLNGTTNLTMEERGQYITLLCMQHQIGHLTKKAIDLQVPSVSDDVMVKFEKDENGLYFNRVMDEVIEQREKYVESRYLNGYKGGRPKKENNHMDNHMHNHMIDINKDINSNINKRESMRERFYTDDELNDIFNDFLELRKKLKAQNTDRAVKLLLNTLEDFDDDIKIKMIEQSITNSWKGLFPLKRKKGMSSSDIDKLG